MGMGQHPVAMSRRIEKVGVDMNLGSVIYLNVIAFSGQISRQQKQVIQMAESTLLHFFPTYGRCLLNPTLEP
jgi:hypothetical protein